MTMHDWGLATNDVKALHFFEGKESDVCAQCCKVAVDFLRTGINAKLYSNAAAKLSVDVESLKDATEAIMTVITEAAAHNLSADDLRRVLNVVSEPLNPSLCDSIVASFERVSVHLKETLTHMEPLMMPRYKSLKWRLNLQAASRACENTAGPTVNLKLMLTDVDHSTREQWFDVCPSTLKRLTAQAEAALAQLRTREYRRVAKFL